jgi:hypothetical protein
MILFILEGKKPEVPLCKTMNRLFVKDPDDAIHCVYGTIIYELYRELKALGDGSDIVAVMKEKDETLRDRLSSDFAEIYLFFDYDIHHEFPQPIPIDELNKRLNEMLNYFNNETENGKLYVSYPMSESIRYTKQLPDENYHLYQVTRDECKTKKAFKHNTNEFSFYINYDFIQFDFTKPIPSKKIPIITDNWQKLKLQNVMKANYICNGKNVLPERKEDIAQLKIFEAQLQHYVNKTPCQIAVLSAFPLFIYDYCK